MYGLRPNHFPYDVLDGLLRLMLDFRFCQIILWYKTILIEIFIYIILYDVC